MAGQWTWISLISAILGILISIPLIMGLFGKNKFDVSGKTCLLTGASEGMGLSVAKQLAQKGANIVIVSRSVEKLKNALGQVQASAKHPSQRFKYISADLSEADGSARVLQQAMEWNDGVAPDVVWCIAGAAATGFFLETEAKTMRQQMDTNYWSCADMAHAVLKIWLAPGSSTKNNTRHLIFTSSVAALYSFVGYSAYSPAKAAIKSLSDTLASEILLYGEDVKIHTIFPGTITSPGLEKENITKPDITHILEKADTVQTPEVVAANSIKGLENGNYLVTVSWLGDAMMACAWGGSKRSNRFLDTIVTWITSIVWIFLGPSLDGDVRKYGKTHGHPSTYPKKS